MTILIPFTQHDGESIYLNPAHITGVTPLTESYSKVVKTRIVTVAGGWTADVTEDTDRVLKAIRDAEAPDQRVSRSIHLVPPSNPS